MEASKIGTAITRLLPLISEDPGCPIYVGLGDKEPALEWLRRAYDEHSYWLSWLGVDPRWDPLRSDSRFREVEQRVGVVPK
jgi:hypothetical protein